MYHLTADQYDAFFLAALNLVAAIQEGREYADYAIHLSACTAILTGQYIKENIVELAKNAPNKKRESIEAIIRHLIGDFTYDPEYWKRNSISMDEVKALGGI